MGLYKLAKNNIQTSQTRIQIESDGPEQGASKQHIISETWYIAEVILKITKEG